MIEPPVEVTTSVGTVIVFAALLAPRLMLPPLVIVKAVEVADLTIFPFVVTEPVSDGADSVFAPVPAVIAPVERLPVDAVRVSPPFPVTTLPTVTEPLEIVTELSFWTVMSVVDTEPLLAVRVSACDVMVVAVMLPAVAVAVRLLAVVIAPRLILPVLEVTVIFVF